MEKKGLRDWVMTQKQVKYCVLLRVKRVQSHDPTTGDDLLYRQ